MPARGRVLVVDLNNFARYPTVSVGYLVAVCRRAGFAVDVCSPLALGVRGVVRERRPRPWSALFARWNHRAATHRLRPVRAVRERLARIVGASAPRGRRRIVGEIHGRIASVRPDVVLVSTYLMYHSTVDALGRECARAGIPLLVGGPYFADPRVAGEWIGVPGLTALVGGEVELELPAILDDVMAGRDPSRHDGLWLPGAAGRLRGRARPPLHDLDAVPYPDYSDFPWSRYPERIAPVVTGRGCSWSACSFCSDVTSSAGRTYRSRSPDSVLDEITHHVDRHGTRLFTFTDLKLNSDLAVWHGLLDHLQERAGGARWIAAVHAQTAGRPAEGNGLGPDELRAAAASGCVRLTTGLESGSQRMLDRMRKGTEVGEARRFLRDARRVGISTRVTMIHGYPGERAEDVRASAAFLEAHETDIERVTLNRFRMMTGTRVHRAWERRPEGFPDVGAATARHRDAWVEHAGPQGIDREHRRAVFRLLDAVHRINRRPLGQRARVFEGVM